MKKKLILFILLFSAVLIFSKEIEGIFFPDTIDVDGKKLVLNGVGLRLKKVLLLNIKIYAGGLYLEQKEANPQKIMTEEKSKAIVMHFIYSNVGKDKLTEAFIDGFDGNGAAEAKKLKPEIDKFLSFWCDMVKDDEAKIIYIPGKGTKVVIKGKEAGLIESPQFAKLLFSVWLGQKPPNEELKAGMLGGS
jgi:hypothetical protein